MSKIDIYVTVILNVVTDAYLMTIPAPVSIHLDVNDSKEPDLLTLAQMLWKARLPLRRKLSLVVLFSGGLFVMMAGILRCVLILTVWNNPASFHVVSVGHVILTLSTLKGWCKRCPTSRKLGLP